MPNTSEVSKYLLGEILHLLDIIKHSVQYEKAVIGKISGSISAEDYIYLF